MSIHIKWSGALELEKKLKQINESMARKAVRKAVAEAAKILVPAVKSKLVTGHGVRTGNMRDSVDYVVRQRKKRSAYAIVGPRFEIDSQRPGSSDNPGRIAHLVEYGHGGPHPAPAYPFMRPAFDEQIKAMQNAVITSLAQSLAEAAAKA